MVTARISEDVNRKQVEAFTAVFSMVAYYEACKKAKAAGLEKPAPARYSDTLREFYYGGAIRGGKTYLYLTIFCLLAKMYPGSRWHVIRRSFTELSGITESSLVKILGNTPCRWKRSTKEYFVQFRNGSRIYFFSENYNADPAGNRFLGLETNGILLEQMEELNWKTYQQCLQRAGSWYIPKQPPTLILGTFNPTFGWVKEVVYDPWIADTTEDRSTLDFHYTPALPTDNTHVTDEQWKQWSKLDPITYDRMIRGIWELDFRGRFYYAFVENKHVRSDLVYNDEFPLYYSFDFNVDPACAIVFQTDKESFFHILDEVRVENGDTPVVCDQLKERWRVNDPYELVTGDATGLNRMSGLRGHLNQYQVIKAELEIEEEQFILSLTNPEIPDSRTFVNSIWARFPNCYVHKRCKWLIHDLNFTKIKRDAEGKVGIQKTGKLENAPLNAESMGHLGDGSRYGMHNTLHDFVTIPRS